MAVGQAIFKPAQSLVQLNTLKHPRHIMVYYSTTSNVHGCNIVYALIIEL